MPAIVKRSKVLVSGANGFLAMWTTRLLLERGYDVRGTVRSEEKCMHLNRLFASMGYKNRFEVVIIEDISKEGAFDEAVKDVDAIVHIASPITAVESPDEMIGPAVDGTTGILKSAMNTGNSVKRVVVTSSTCAVMPPAIDQRTVLSELDWDTHFPKVVEEQGSNAHPYAVYCAAKTLAERGAWGFYNNHKSETPWDIVTLVPSWIFGPPIHEVKSASSLNYSLTVWYNTVVVDKTSSKEFLSAPQAWVDVRDLALAHVLALETPEAGGERIIISAGPFVWQDWLDVANSLSTSSTASNDLPVGFPEMTQEERRYDLVLDTSKQRRLLDIKFRTLKETAKDIFEDIDKRGWQ